MLAVEVGVEGVVEKHAADVKRACSDADQEQSREFAAAGNDPARQAIGPDRRQVRDAAKEQQSPEDRHAPAWLAVHSERENSTEGNEGNKEEKPSALAVILRNWPLGGTFNFLIFVTFVSC